MLHAVILAGGSGTRFWPRSRRDFPKQFLSVEGNRSLLQQTLERTEPLIDAANVWIVTHQDYASTTASQVPLLPHGHLLSEPCRRNTAPAIALAAHRLLLIEPDPIMLVAPADHVISTTPQFQQAVQTAVDWIEQSPQSLVLMGAQPSYPATGFGYIQCGAPLRIGQPPVFRVNAFREKPDLPTAAGYLSEGGYLWNCGIFVWRARAILDALAEFAPRISAPLRLLKSHWGTPAWHDELDRLYEALPSLSIDYAVLESTRDACVVAAPFTWDDVGSWDAMRRLRPVDTNGNVADGLHCAVDTTACIIQSSADHLIATCGVDSLVIVHTPGATLVADRRDEASLKRLIAELEARGLTEYL